ncbi:MAG: phosphate signaling complex protein PhoU [Lachnospiraceae bacterium]
MATRTEFLKELNSLNENVYAMGREVELQVEKTIQAFQSGDEKLCREIMAHDDAIDATETNLEQRCIDIVISQTPVGTDMRRVASYMRMVGDLERMADNCCDIAEYLLRMDRTVQVKPPKDFGPMFDEMRSMVSETIDSFYKGDVELADHAAGRDSAVDDMFEEIRRKLEKRMKADPQNISNCVNYLMIAKYVERIGDHAQSIASWVSYIVKGQLKMFFTDRYKNEAAKDN